MSRAFSRITLAALVLGGALLSLSVAEGQSRNRACTASGGVEVPQSDICPDNRPVVNDSVTTAAGNKCCMTAEQSTRVNQQIAAEITQGSAGGGNQTPPSGGNQTPGTAGGNQTPGTGGGNQTPPNSSGSLTVNFENPLRYDTVEAVLDSVMDALRNIVAILAIIFIIIGGLLYITSGGDQKRIDAAKKAVTAALIGLAIVLAAPSFLKEIYDALGGEAILPSQAAGAPGFLEIARNVLNFLLSIVGVVAIIMLLVGGLIYLTATGDEKKAETGKNIVKYAIIGLIVCFAALVLVTQIAGFF